MIKFQNKYRFLIILAIVLVALSIDKVDNGKCSSFTLLIKIKPARTGIYSTLNLEKFDLHLLLAGLHYWTGIKTPGIGWTLAL